MTRDRQVAIRLSEEELEALTAAARREDVPSAHIIRRGLKRELERLKAEEKKTKRPR